MTDAVMIFAAGFGTRMGALTRSMPKPMIPISGKPLIDYALGYVADAGIEKIVVNTHYLAEQLHTHLKPKGVRISHEADQILDTGGGLRAALPLLEADTVFTLNPDVLWMGPNPLQLLRQQWKPDTMDALLLCTPLSRTHGRHGGGDFHLSEDRQITRPGDLVYGGAQIIKTDRLHDIEDDVFSLNEIWNQMNESRRLHLAVYCGAWCDVGTPDGISLAESLLEQKSV